jgi:hypothetical protein
MVIYNNGQEGDQYGGVPNEFHAKGSLCQGVTGAVGKVCADLKVNMNVGFAKCDFAFKKDGTSCGGEEIKKVTVEKGKDNNGVQLTDEVRFVQVNCSSSCVGFWVGETVQRWGRGATKETEDERVIWGVVLPVLEVDFRVIFPWTVKKPFSVFRYKLRINKRKWPS